MAGQPGRSGGANRLSLEQHQLAGSYRADRHAHLKPTPPPRDLSPAERRRILAGLPSLARKLAVQWIDAFEGWEPGSLEVLRAYVLSCARLEALQRSPSDDTRQLHREVRTNLALLRELRQGEAARCR